MATLSQTELDLLSTESYLFQMGESKPMPTCSSRTRKAHYRSARIRRTTRRAKP